jgi:hypothetical protein
MAEFHEISLPFTTSTWMALRSAIMLAKKKMPGGESPAVTLENFLRSIKKGSKKFREVIDRSVYQSRSVQDITVVSGFSRIVDTTLPNEIII